MNAVSDLRNGIVDRARRVTNNTLDVATGTMKGGLGVVGNGIDVIGILANGEGLDSLDVFAEISYKDATFRTATVLSAQCKCNFEHKPFELQAPMAGEKGSVPSNSGEENVLLKVYDSLQLMGHTGLAPTTDTLIGSCAIRWSEICRVQDAKVIKIQSLTNSKGVFAGEVFFEVQYIQSSNIARVRMLRASMLTNVRAIAAAEETSGSSSSWKTVIAAAVWLVTYLLVGTIFYSQYEGALWLTEQTTYHDGTANGTITIADGPTFLDGLYFSVETLTTVGYGDMGPQNTTSRVFTMFYVVFGLTFMGVSMGVVAGIILDKQEEYLKIAMGAAVDAGKLGVGQLETLVDNLDGESDLLHVKEIPKATISKSVKATLYNLLQLAFIIGTGTLWYCVVEDTTFVNGLYYAVITATTVGYGDEKPLTQVGRAIAIPYMILAVLSTANTLGAIAGLPLQLRRDRMLKEGLDRFNETLSPSDLDRICKSFGGTDGRCNESEFILGILSEIGTISKNDIDRMANKFEILDSDGSGFLGISDVVDASLDTSDLSPPMLAAYEMYQKRKKLSLIEVEIKVSNVRLESIRQSMARIKPEIKVGAWEAKI